MSKLPPSKGGQSMTLRGHVLTAANRNERWRRSSRWRAPQCLPPPRLQEAPVQVMAPSHIGNPCPRREALLQDLGFLVCRCSATRRMAGRVASSRNVPDGLERCLTRMLPSVVGVCRRRSTIIVVIEHSLVRLKGPFLGADLRSLPPGSQGGSKARSGTGATRSEASKARTHPLTRPSPRREWT